MSSEIPYESLMLHKMEDVVHVNVTKT